MRNHTFYESKLSYVNLFEVFMEKTSSTCVVALNVTPKTLGNPRIKNERGRERERVIVGEKERKEKRKLISLFEDEGSVLA